MNSDRSNVRLGFWLGFVVLFSALSYAGNFFGPEPPRDLLFRYETAAAGLVQFGIMLGIMLLIAIEAPKRDLFALRRPVSWKVAAGLAAAVLVAVFVIGGLVGLVLDPTREQGLLPEKWRPERLLAYALNGVIVAGVAPVVEEVTFRGLGFRLLERFGQPIAIGVSAFAFALAHGLVEAFPVIFAFGLGLGYLRSRTQSIYPCIALHAVFNLMQLVFAAVAASRG